MTSLADKVKAAAHEAREGRTTTDVESWTGPVTTFGHELMLLAVDALEAKDEQLAAANNGHAAVEAHLQARIAELERELAKAKDVPMKYKRMEFNAQLQRS